MNLVLINPTLRAFDDRHNLNEIERLVTYKRIQFSPDDILLLPEHFTSNDNAESYAEYISKLAGIAGCTVVGGSHHRTLNGKRMNMGCVIDSRGTELGVYTKLRPYFNEQKHVVPGDRVGDIDINGKNFLILICADFWYSDILLNATRLPDVVLVPSLSVSRKPNADYSRTLWTHLAITRAYEFGVFVGISDWSENSRLPKNRTCGVSGLADPTQLDPEKFFTPVSQEGISFFPLDFAALNAFRDDRKMRGFFWKK
jgi:predicted amidohydrolase